MRRLAKRKNAGPAYQRMYARQNVRRTQAARVLQGAIRTRYRGLPATINMRQTGYFRQNPRIELKAVDVPLGDAINAIPSTVNTNAFCYILNGVQQGASDYQRVGNTIQMKAIRLNLNFNYFYLREAAFNNNLNYNRIRCVLLLWKSVGATGTLPAFDAVFKSVDQAGNNTTNFHTLPQFSRNDEYVILRDWNHDFTPIGDTAGGAASLVYIPWSIDEYVKLGGLPVRYVGTANPIVTGNFGSNALLLYVRAAVNSALQTQCQMATTSTARLTYYD